MTIYIGRRDRVIFLCLLAIFSVLNFLAAAAGEGFGSGIMTAAGTLSGPMTGAISRGMQICCYNFSVNLMPYFLPFPLLALAAQVRWRAEPSGEGSEIFRSIAWAIGWLGWFTGGIVSFGHALC